MKIRFPMQVMVVLALFLTAVVSPSFADEPVHMPGNGDAKLAAWSPNGEWLAVVSDVALTLYTAELEQVAAFEPEETITSLVWHPDSQQLATTSHAWLVQLWEISSGTVQTLYSAGNGEDRYTGSVSYSPDGTQLASAHLDNAIRIWNLADRTLAKTLEIEAPATAVAWHPDGEWLAVGSSLPVITEDDETVTGASIQIWDVASATIFKRLDSDKFLLGNGYEEISRQPDFVPVTFLQWYANGTRLLMQTSDINDRRGWEILDETNAIPEPMNILAECGTVYDLARFAPDGNRVAVGEGIVGNCGSGGDEEPKISWGLEITSQRDDIQWLSLLLHSSAIRDITWHPNNVTLAVVTDEGTVAIATFDPTRHQDWIEPHLVLDA